MYTNTSAPLATLRMPLQAPGVGRGTARTSALAAGGVEAAGLGSFLTNLLGLPEELGSAIDSVGNIALDIVPGGHGLGQMLAPYIP